MIAVNKADGDNIPRAKQAAAEYRAALHILSARADSWSPPVVTYSGLTGDGIAELWSQVEQHRALVTKSGALEARRREQQVKWMWTMLEDRIHARLRTDPALKAKLPRIESDVAAGRLLADAGGRGDRDRVGDLGSYRHENPLHRFRPVPRRSLQPERRACHPPCQTPPPGFCGVERVAHVFPTAYAAVDRELPTLIAKHKPDALVMFGLGRPHTACPDRDAGAQPDHPGLSGRRRRRAGLDPHRAAVEPDRCAAAHRSAGCCKPRRASGVRAKLSRDAGAYLCNYSYWRGIEAAAKSGGPRLVVFVHIPKTRMRPRRRGRPMMSMPKLLRAGEAIGLAALSALRRSSVRPQA